MDTKSLGNGSQLEISIVAFFLPYLVLLFLKQQFRWEPYLISTNYLSLFDLRVKIQIIEV